MTIYKTDFSEYSTGSLPSDWSLKWNDSAHPVEVKAGGTGNIGGQYLEVDLDANDAMMVVWDDVAAGGSITELEYLIRAKIPTALAGGSTWIMIALPLRAADNASGEDSYMACIAEDGVEERMQKRVSGTSSTPWSNFRSRNPVEIGEYYWHRARVSGSQLTSKAWLDGTPEPEHWTLDVTDSTLTAAEYAGLYFFTPTAGPYEIDYFCAASAGDTAEYPDDDVSEVGRATRVYAEALTTASNITAMATRVYAEVLTSEDSATSAAVAQPIINICC